MSKKNNPFIIVYVSGIDNHFSTLNITHMSNLILEPTKSTPSVSFCADGNLEITGRSIPENAPKFFRPLIEWSESHNAEKTILSIKLEYLNTSSSKVLFEILKNLENNHSREDVLIKWHFEEGDEDVLETGKFYESLLDIPFEYYEYAEY